MLRRRPSREAKPKTRRPMPRATRLQSAKFRLLLGFRAILRCGLHYPEPFPGSDKNAKSEPGSISKIIVIESISPRAKCVVDFGTTNNRSRTAHGERLARRVWQHHITKSIDGALWRETRREQIVKHLPFAILAIFCLSTSASAQNAPSTANGTPQRLAQHNVFQGNVGRGLVSNRNQCAPGYAHAVWGPNSALLGYRCSNFPGR
jgi:hypothetical protein